MNQTIFDHAYTGAEPNPSALKLADIPPPWRRLAQASNELETRQDRVARAMDSDQALRGRSYRADEHEARLVNAAFLLRRPLLITGQAGVGKTSLAYAVAWQLGLGNVLRWGITSRSTLKEALYQYDAIARLHDASLREKDSSVAPMSIGNYITLGPLGTALLPSHSRGYFPRVLLIDEIDKSDADLPSDLLHILEEGSFQIPEIARLPDTYKRSTITVQTADGGDSRAPVPASGTVRCDDFPLIIMTSNGERDFPPAFLRRCLRLEIAPLSESRLLEVVQAHLGTLANDANVKSLIEEFQSRRTRDRAVMATDQLLNAVFIARSGLNMTDEARSLLKDALLRSLTDSPQAG